MGGRDGAIIIALSAVFCLYTSILMSSHLHSTPNHNIKPRQNFTKDCTTNLAGDLYGLGVRLGVYFQWFSGWVSNNFIIDEINGGLDGNSIFLFALLISMVSSTKSDDMCLMDGLILLLLCAGTIWSVLSLWGYRTCVYRKEGLGGIRRFGGFGTHLRLLLGGAVSWYGIWFWVIGIKGLPDGLASFNLGDPSQNCPKSEVTVFGCALTGDFAHYASLAISAISVTYSLLITLATPIGLVTRTRKMVSFARAKQYASTTRLRFATGASERQLVIASWVFCGFNMLWILFAMLLIELALNENYALTVLGGNVSNGQLDKPAQLLPMLIGAFSFVRILFIAYELWRNPRGDLTPSLGRDASRRYTKTKRDSERGINILKLFSEGNADVEEVNVQREQNQPVWDDRHDDLYYDLHRRLNMWQRILVTWMPWLSLLWFWPWQKDVGRPISRAEDTLQLRPRNEPISLQTPHRTRFADFDDELDDHSTETGYHRPTEVTEDDAQHALEPAKVV